MDQPPLDGLQMSLMSHDASLVSEQVSYAIWGSIAASCKAFGKVTIKIHAPSNRVFVAVELRWWAKIKRLEPFRRFWMKRAEKAAEEFVPKGWRLLVYYVQEPNGRSNSTHRRSESKDSDHASNGGGHGDSGHEYSTRAGESGTEATSGSNEIEGRWPFSKAWRG